MEIQTSPQQQQQQRRNNNGFWKLFHCVAKKNRQEKGHSSFGATSPGKDPSVLLELERNNKMDSLSMSLCEISNSSLRDVEHMALEDELNTYMKEIKLRERCN